MGKIGSQDPINYFEMNRMSIKKELNHDNKPEKTGKWQTLRPQLFVSLNLAFGAMIVGFGSAYSSPALASMSQPESKLHPTAEEKSWIGSLLPLFAAVGGILAGWLMTVLGRKKVIFVHGFPYVVSFILIAAAQNLAMVLVGRGLMGLCIGISTTIFPIYIGETIQAKYRGFFGLFPSILGNSGILLSYVAGMFLNWSELALLGALLPIPFIIGSYVIPETPRWLTNKGEVKKSIQSLQWLRGKENIYDEFLEIDINQSGNKNENSGFWDLLRFHYTRPLLICLFLMFFQQSSGINAIIFYSVDIFRESGSVIDSNIQSIILGAVNLFSTITATLLIDKLGRKKLLYISSVMMSLTLTVLGFYFRARANYKEFNASNNINEESLNLINYSWLPLACLVVYIMSFSIGFGPIPWLMMGEILPSHIKGRGASLSTTFNWLCSFIITKTFGTMILSLGSDKTFWLYGASCILATFFITFFVPETKGKSLEEIEKIFLSSSKMEESKKQIKNDLANANSGNSINNHPKNKSTASHKNSIETTIAVAKEASDITLSEHMIQNKDLRKKENISVK